MTWFYQAHQLCWVLKIWLILCVLFISCCHPPQLLYHKEVMQLLDVVQAYIFWSREGIAGSALCSRNCPLWWSDAIVEGRSRISVWSRTDVTGPAACITHCGVFYQCLARHLSLITWSQLSPLPSVTQPLCCLRCWNLKGGGWWQEEAHWATGKTWRPYSRYHIIVIETKTPCLWWLFEANHLTWRNGWRAVEMLYFPFLVVVKEGIHILVWWWEDTGHMEYGWRVEKIAITCFWMMVTWSSKGHRKPAKYEY